MLFSHISSSLTGLGLGLFGPQGPIAADMLVMHQQLAALHAIQDVALDPEEDKEDKEEKDDKDIAEMKRQDMEDPDP